MIPKGKIHFVVYKIITHIHFLLCCLRIRVMFSWLAECYTTAPSSCSDQGNWLGLSIWMLVAIVFTHHCHKRILILPPTEGRRLSAAACAGWYSVVSYDVNMSMSLLPVGCMDGSFHLKWVTNVTQHPELFCIKYNIQAVNVQCTN